jgi:hypothetical protein
VVQVPLGLAFGLRGFLFVVGVLLGRLFPGQGRRGVGQFALDVPVRRSRLPIRLDHHIGVLPLFDRDRDLLGDLVRALLLAIEGTLASTQRQKRRVINLFRAGILGVDQYRPGGGVYRASSASICSWA